MGVPTKFTLTDSWQKIADRRCVVTVEEITTQGAILSLNNAAVDATARSRRATEGLQAIETETQALYAKGYGVVVVVDEVTA